MLTPTSQCCRVEWSQHRGAVGNVIPKPWRDEEEKQSSMAACKDPPGFPSGSATNPNSPHVVGSLL